jgi:hypothetical protein
MKNLQGGCHCGAVRFAVELTPPVELLDCNCSICAKSGLLHLIVPHGDFTLLGGSDSLSSYRFGSNAADHLFCKICGIKSFYQPRSHPHAWSVNFRCLDPGHGLEPQVRAFDGQNWESARAELNDEVP